ncbi:hypothetical protein ACODT4_00550 [Streptomyces sp. 2.9]|uniref:hypothetical protein n=1 Tax=Streptomyces tritrimontium TaxID=3406573 RepID=UPI003BB58F00
MAKADRRGLVETSRECLQRTERQAAALSAGDSDFLERLRDSGLRVHERRDDDGVLVGYAVGLPGDRADGGSRPVWFSGGCLAYDLTLPRVRERFEIPVGADGWGRAGRGAVSGWRSIPRCGAPRRRGAAGLTRRPSSRAGQDAVPWTCQRPVIGALLLLPEPVNVIKAGSAVYRCAGIV